MAITGQEHHLLITTAVLGGYQLPLNCHQFKKLSAICFNQYAWHIRARSGLPVTISSNEGNVKRQKFEESYSSPRHHNYVGSQLKYFCQ